MVPSEQLSIEVLVYAGPVAVGSIRGITAVSARVGALESQLAQMTNLLEQHLAVRTQAPPVPQPVTTPPVNTGFDSFISQLRMFKEVMTVMQPPSTNPPSTPVYPMNIPSAPQPLHPMPTLNTRGEPSFNLETIERLAKMFK